MGSRWYTETTESMPAYKLFRDPVHNIISFDAKNDRLILDLIDAPSLQRLRYIRQLGLSWVAFPGAEHSRFTHAIGACYLAGRILDHLSTRAPINPLERTTAMAAALLHDIGHGPFSHLYETVFPNALSHEAWGIEILTHPHSDVAQVLRAYDPTLAERIANVLRKTYRPLYVVQMVSSQLDVDRFDYLLRDSRMTGAQYGLFDIEWIINSLVLADIPLESGVERGLAIDAGRGLHSVEQHLLGRHFMYRQVYFHPACRSADMIAKAIFKRLTVIDVPEGTPTALADAARGRQPGLAAYLELDDFVMLDLFKHWARHAADPILKDLCGRLINRKLFYTLDWSGIADREIASRYEELRNRVAAAGFDPDFYAMVDRASDTPYRDIMAYTEAGKPSEEIWLVTESGVRPLSQISDVFRTLSNRPVAQVYAGFPREAKELVLDHLANL